MANLQLQVYESIARFSTADPRYQEALSKLNVELQDVSKVIITMILLGSFIVLHNTPRGVSKHLVFSLARYVELFEV